MLLRLRRNLADLLDPKDRAPLPTPIRAEPPTVAHRQKKEKIKKERKK